MTQTACFAIMSEKVPIGQATDPEYTNADKIIGKADCTDGEILNEDGGELG